MGGRIPPHCLSETKMCSTLILAGVEEVLSPWKLLPELSISTVTDDDFDIWRVGLRDHVHCLHCDLLVKAAVKET